MCVHSTTIRSEVLKDRQKDQKHMQGNSRTTRRCKAHQACRLRSSRSNTDWSSPASKPDAVALRKAGLHSSEVARNPVWLCHLLLHESEGYDIGERSPTFAGRTDPKQIPRYRGNRQRHRWEILDLTLISWRQMANADINTDTAIRTFHTRAFFTLKHLC